MENKEEINKHLERFVKSLPEYKETDLLIYLKDYQKKYNLIPSIEVGDVVKNSSGTAILITKIDEECNNFLGYGFGCDKDWLGFSSFFWLDSAKKIPREEWQSMLLEKAKKDYPGGTKVKSVCGKYTRDVMFPFLCRFDAIIDSNGNGIRLFDNGVWAEIIEQPKEVETEETEILDALILLRNSATAYVPEKVFDVVNKVIDKYKTP